MPRTTQTHKRLTCLTLFLGSSSVGGYLPPPRGSRRGNPRSSSSNFASSVNAVADWQQPASFFEEPQEIWRRPVADGESFGRSSGARSTESVEEDSLAFFAPNKNTAPRPWDDDEYDDLLPPPLPEPVREGELGGGRYEDAAEGRTEGFYAALTQEPDRLRASDLNEVLQPDHLNRLRFTNFPLQAYGALFKWDVLIEDVLRVYREPWRKVAEEHNLPVPDDDEVMRATGIRAERAIMQVFRWTNDWGETQKYAYDHYHYKNELFRDAEFTPSEGVVEWLELLRQYQVPCCLCAGTSLDVQSVEVVLAKAGIAEYFDACVTAEDGCETAEQSFLVGSIKLRRPPMRCVVFEDDPKGVAAAHEATSKAVALMGTHFGSDLRHADMRISAFDDLSLMSLRELFKDMPPIE